MEREIEQIIVISWPSYFTVKAYCLCGDATHLRTTDDLKFIEKELADFHAKHTGAGHGPCDDFYCQRARQKRQRKETGAG